MSYCHKAGCWGYRHCTQPSSSSWSTWCLSTLLMSGEQVLWLPSRSPCRSQGQGRGYWWWSTQDTWIGEWLWAHSHRWWWLVVLVYLGPGHLSSSDWWSAQSLCRPGRSGPYAAAVPFGCVSWLRHHQQTTCFWWGLHRPLSSLLGRENWRDYHLIWSSGRFPLVLCQMCASGGERRRSQRELGQVHCLVWLCCAYQRAWRGCHWTAQSPSCWGGRTQLSCAVLGDSQSYREPWRGHLCWQGWRPWWGQWMQCTGASATLCTSLGVDGGRTPCLP